MPSHVAMMSEQEVLQELDNHPGVSVPKTTSSKDKHRELETTAPQLATDRAAVASDGEPAYSQHETEDENGSDDAYLPSANSDHSQDDSEEEYNDFNEESDSDSDAPPSPLRDIWRKEPAALKEQFLKPRQDLFLPLRLYIMADRYDVPSLRLLARDRFYRAAEASWKVADCFPSVVDELYSYTPDSNVAMREIVCRLVANSLEEDETRKRMEPVMRKHGDFAVGVMNWNILYTRETW
jgi:hypothetical protein